jgi:hypothetical protein
MAMCFRDREFCSAPCLTSACIRNLNDTVYAEAARWWDGMRGEPPIAMRDMSEGCEHFQPMEVAEA